MKSFFIKFLCFAIFCLFLIPGTGLVHAEAGKSIVESRCTSCHGTGRIKNADYTPAQWEKTVKRMMAKNNFGSELTDNEMQNLLNYLNSM